MTARARYLGRLPPAARIGPSDDEVLWFELAGGERVGLRPIHRADRPALLQGFAGLSEESRYQRFLGPMNHLSARQAEYLTDVDQADHFAWVAGKRDDDGSEHGLGIARYVRVRNEPGAAEVAVVVADDFHGRGLGTLLVAALVPVAADHGVVRLVGYFFATNEAMLRVFLGLGAAVQPDSAGVLRADVPIQLATVPLLPIACRALGGVARRARRRRVAAG